MAPELGRVTFVLLALSAAAVEVAAYDKRPVAVSVGIAAAWVAVALALGWLVRSPADPRRRPPSWVLLLLVALAAVPFALANPMELQMVFGLRNVGLGLAACGGWLLCQRLACVVSLFLMLFSAAMTNHPAVMVVLGLYTATGSVWLMLVYWAGLRSVLIAPERAAIVEIQPGRERFPWGGILLLLAGVSAALSLAIIGPKRVAYTLGEWMPTSGGSGDTDPLARYGVGDGPEETAGENAKAAGMVETDQMIEDNRNALIDSVSEMYGPPHKPRDDQERLVAAGLAKMIENHGKLPDNRRPSRDFDTARKGPKRDGRPESHKARGVFEVEGRTPLHVRQVAYDTYDAATARWVEGRKPPSRRLEPEGGDWMSIDWFRDGVGWYLADERHRLKVAAARSNLVPTPTLLTRFRINKVDKPEYYDWDQDGVLVLAGRWRTPPGVVVTTRCRTLDPSGVPASAFSKGMRREEVPSEVAQLAQAWAGDVPFGWPQVEAIVSRLRLDYECDPETVVPSGHPSPVVWFLTESRRGPDYLFATSAALMLRSLGYQSRTCLGYYAAPEAYDPETGHTPVKVTDLHTWAEVRLTDGHWLVIEPTPGYDILGPSLPLSQLLLAAVGGWMWHNAVALAVVALALALAWWRRRDLIDAAAVGLWRCFPGRTWREQVRRAVVVLERRGRWAGLPRRSGQTVLAWMGDERFARIAEWAAYGPDAPPWPEAEVLTVCRRVLQRKGA